MSKSEKGKVKHKKTDHRGASRGSDYSTANRSPGLAWLRGVLGLAVLVSLGIAIVYSVDLPFAFEAAIDRPVASVSAEGDFHFVSKERITEVMTPFLNKKFLQLNLDDIKKSIEQEAYVDYAVLSRRWPDKLSVRIVEQQPIARWGNKGFLNQRGDVIETTELSFVQDMPVLFGKRDQAQNVMLQYRQISQLIRQQGLEVAELIRDDKLAWKLLLTNGLHILIGQDHVVEKMQRFIAVYKRQLHDKLVEIAMVDVRYDNGVAVRWQTLPLEDDVLASVK